MKRSFKYILFFSFLASISFLIGRSFRVSKVPHGTKFSCNTCHTNGGGSPLNPFGLQVETRVTPDGHENFWSAELAALDSDGDGFTNGEELQDPNGLWTEGSALPGDAALVKNPGNPNDFPTSVNWADSNPIKFELFSNYPNPFNPSTTIKYSIPSTVGTSHDLSLQNVQLKIYDILGREIATLVNEQQQPGNYEIVFNASSVDQQTASGTYFYRLTVDDGANGAGQVFVQTKKMILLK